jgi:hypothetical protein
MANDSDRRHGTAPTAFGPAGKDAREGSAHHSSGWQEEPQKVEKGSHIPPRAPEGSISRTPVANRLRPGAAEQGEG